MRAQCKALPRYVEGGRKVVELQDFITEQLHHRTVETKLLIGFCMMIRRDLLNKIGLLDENLFMGNDDYELSWRIRTHGLRLLVALNVFVHHENQVSFKTISQETKDQYIRDSWAAMERKIKAYYGTMTSNFELWGLSDR